jgi:hypothetical protein
MMLRLGFTDEQILDYLYLASFTRHPNDVEREALLGALASAGKEKTASIDESRREAWVDMSWALLTGKEFMFNH